LPSMLRTHDVDIKNCCGRIAAKKQRPPGRNA
jgi:hypothetical protein